jgi:hypothetical protein
MKIIAGAGNSLRGLSVVLCLVAGLLAGACADKDHVKVKSINLAGSFHALVVDDDEGLTGTGTWTGTLDSLGVPYDVDVVPTDGDPVLPLGDYRVVIWSNGDRAYDNLMPNNVALLSAYLDNGGRLLLAGGHCVYSELQPGASTFIDTYLGLLNYNFDMPTFLNSALPAYTTGSGHPAVGTTTYTLQFWPGGEYGNMFSGFYVGLPTATGLLDHQPGNLNNSGAPDFNGFLAVANNTGTYKTVTWGFDLNHVSPPMQQELLGRTLAFLAQ